MKKIILPVLLIAIAFGIYKYRADLPMAFSRLTENSITQKFLGKISQQDFLPPPLRGSLEGEANLTKDGVIYWTNWNRQQNNLPPLHENAKLDETAAIKLKDMFDKQYFEHESPEGVGPSDLAKRVGYQYAVVGENLALGNFKNDQILLQGWMNSPGHRANILSDRFQEIGIAVGRGTFEGKQTWLAVQSFARPLSSCPSVEESLRKQLNDNNAAISQMQQQIKTMKAAIDSGVYKNRGEYNAKVSEYNSLVDKYNNLIDRTKTIVAKYNAEVVAYNSCLNQA